MLCSYVGDQLLDQDCLTNSGTTEESDLTTFGGYDMQQVDEFLEPLTEDYVTLYKENALLKSKMRVLVGKLEEYRKNEASMKDAVINAQKTCDKMVAEAEAKCARMLSSASAAAAVPAAPSVNSDAMVAAENARVQEARKAAAAKIGELQDQLRTCIQALERIKDATAKFGAGGKFVDNLENGGICCPIDRETGRICGCAHTSRLVTSDEHPDTHIPLMGYQLPMVKEAIDLCLKAALVVEDMRFIGWDVYVSEKGPGIVEGNDYPGYDFSQLPEHTPDKIGMWAYYKKLIPDL